MIDGLVRTLLLRALEASMAVFGASQSQVPHREFIFWSISKLLD
jgi:hypothetical protein